jgi:hypothetical protein
MEIDRCRSNFSLPGLNAYTRRWAPRDHSFFVPVIALATATRPTSLGEALISCYKYRKFPPHFCKADNCLCWGNGEPISEGRCGGSDLMSRQVAFRFGCVAAAVRRLLTKGPENERNRRVSRTWCTDRITGLDAFWRLPPGKLWR